MKQLLVLLVLLPFCFTAHLPSTFKRCPSTDPNFKKCLIAAMEDVFHQSTVAFPEIHMPILDPLEVPQLDIEAGKGPVGFDQHYRNCKLYGVSHAVLSEKTYFDFDTNKLYVDGIIPHFEKICDYNFNGKIMILPIQGEGLSNVTMHNLQAHIEHKFTKYQKNDQFYYKIEETHVTLNPEHIYYHLENLFNGNKELADNVLQVMNDNWREVFEDVKSGYELAFAQIFQQTANNVFAKIPVSELFH